MDDALDILELITSLVEKREYDSALEKINEIDQTRISEKKKIELLHQQCKLYSGLEEYQKGLEFGEAALVQSKKIIQPSLELLSILALQVPLWYLERWSELQTLLERGLEVFKELNESQQNQYLEKKGILLDTLALFSNQKGDFTRALELYKSSLEIAQQVGDKIGEARTVIGIAVIYRNTGNYSESIKYSSAGIEIANKLENNIVKSHAINNIALVNQLMGKLDTALKYTHEVLDIQLDEGNQLHIAATYSNIGSILLDQRKIEDALEYQQKSMEIVKKIDSKFGAIKLADQFSSLYLKTGRYDLAMQFIEEALKLEDKLGDKLTQATLLVNKGMLNCRMGYPKDGINSFEIAKKYLTNLGNPTLLARLEINLGLANKQIGNTENAMKHYLEAFELSKSIDHATDMAMSALYIALHHHSEGNNGELRIWYQKIESIEHLGDSKVLDIVKTISKALFSLESSTDMRIGELKSLVEDEIYDYDLSLLSIFHLSLLILTNIEEKSIIRNLTLLMRYIDKIVQFAESTKSYVNLIDSYYLKAKLFSVQGEINEAFNHLEYAIKLSSDLGLQAQLDELEKEEKNLREIVENWKSKYKTIIPPEVKIVETNILEFLNNKTGSWGSLPNFDL